MSDDLTPLTREEFEALAAEMGRPRPFERIVQCTPETCDYKHCRGWRIENKRTGTWRFGP